MELRESSDHSEATLNKIRSVYRTFFAWALAREKITRNPSAGLTLARTSSLPTTPITALELEALLNTIRASGATNAKRDELLFSIYAFTGIRRSEALALKIGDYDAVTRNFSMRVAKDGRKRIQPVPEPLAKLIEQYLCGNGSGADDNVFLFPGSDGNHHLSARQAQTLFTSWKQLSGIRECLSIRSLRAGFATMLYRSTGNIWLVACALGHSGLQTVRRYVQTDVAEIRLAIERAVPLRQIGLTEK